MKREEALDDLAFMKSLVQSGVDIQRPIGEGYVAAGVCYGVQTLLHIGQGLGLVGDQGLTGLAVGLGPTVVFLALITWLTIRNRRQTPSTSLVSRAVGAVFAAFGLSNIALIAIIGSQALRLKSLEVWLIYPCVVLGLQGAAWMIVYALQRRAWIAVMSAGWFVTGVAMAFSIGHPLWFVATTSFGLWGLMVIPGLYMMRRAKEA